MSSLSPWQTWGGERRGGQRGHESEAELLGWGPGSSILFPSSIPACKQGRQDLVTSKSLDSILYPHQ